MYFKVSMRTNPATGSYCGYYRLVESYRNHSDRVCHRTMLNAGYLDGLTTDQLNLIQKILTAKVANHGNALFELPYTDDPTVVHYVDDFFKRMVAEKRIDVLVEKKDKRYAGDNRLISPKSSHRRGGHWCPAPVAARYRPWPPFRCAGDQ